MAVNKGLLLRRILLSLVIFGGAGILGTPFIGKWFWDSTQTALQNRGEKLFAKDFEKRSVPKENNYFEIAYFASDEPKRLRESTDSLKEKVEQTEAALRKRREFDWRLNAAPTEAAPAESEVEKNVLLIEQELKQWAALRDTLLAEGKSRTQALAPYRLEDGLMGDVGFVRSTMSIAQMLRGHALVALYRKDGASAFQDVLGILRASRALAGEPALISYLGSMVTWQAGLDTCLAGMDLWSDEQLGELRNLLRDCPFDRTSLVAIIRTERAAFNATMEEAVNTGNMGLLTPGSKSRGSKVASYYLYVPWANYNIAMQKLIDITAANPLDVANYKAFSEEIESRRGVEKFMHILESLGIPAFDGAAYKYLRYRDESEMTRLAIALELYRRKNGSYPSKLAELVPGYIEAISPAALPNQSFNYALSEPQGYRLWTYGWNGTDEKGVPEKFHARDGDWVLAHEKN